MNSNYTILNADQIDREGWQNYVDNHSYGTVFHTFYLYDIYQSTPNYEPFAFFAVNTRGSIIAMLTGFLQTVKSGLLSSISTRAVMLQGPIYTDTKSLDELLEHYIRWSRAKAVYTEVRNHYLDSDYSACLESCSFKWEGHYNIMREIPASSEQLWKEVGRKRKDGINKAKRYNFIVSEGSTSNTVKEFYALLSSNYKQLRLPIPDEVFFSNCLSKDQAGYCKLFKLEDSGVTKIVLLSFLYHGILHAVYIGSAQDPEFISKRPVDFFYYEVMRWCVENKVKYFDWLGAGKPNVSYGVRDFKLQYGGELVDYGRYIFVHSAIKFKIAETGFNVLQKLKGKI